jgi:hypothetical protein
MTQLERIEAQLDAEVAAEMESKRVQRHARDVTPAEYEAKLAELKRGPKPEPLPPIDKTATDAERAEWLREHKHQALVAPTAVATKEFAIAVKRHAPVTDRTPTLTVTQGRNGPINH